MGVARWTCGRAVVSIHSGFGWSIGWCVVATKEVLGKKELAQVGERLVKDWRGTLVLALVVDVKIEIGRAHV